MATVSEETPMEFRLSADEKGLVEQAADLSGQPVASFVAGAVLDAARKLLDEHCIIRLSNRDRDRLFELLENPPEPNERLKAAARWHKENVIR